MLNSNLPPLLSHFSLIYYGFRPNISYQRIKTTCWHSSRCHHYHYCHYCNVDFVFFHNVTCFTNSVLSHIHVNTAHLLNIITCTVVATDVILGKLVRVYHKDRLNNLLDSAHKRHRWFSSDWISSSSCWIFIMSSDPTSELIWSDPKSDLQTAHPGHNLQ